MRHEPEMAGPETAWPTTPACYVPRNLVDTLCADPMRPSPWLDTVEGTLAMADVSGFTSMSERLADSGKEGAEVLTDIISGFFGRVLGLAWEQGGITMGFGGDAMLLLFTGDGHAHRAMAASLAMLQETRRTQAYSVGDGRVKLGMSMGAHTGSYHLAAAGVDGQRMQYLILGPDTTRTAEAESAAEAGQLMASEETVLAVGSAATVREAQGLYLVESVEEPRQRTFVGESEQLPRQVVDRIMPYVPPALGASLSNRGSSPLVEPEHRKVATVFLNIMGVDDMLARNGPRRLLTEVAKYVETSVRLADQYGGFVLSNDIYTQGFKIIVTFGAPIAHEEDTANALRFAHDLREEVAGLDLDLKHRTGVNSGFVFAGDVGPRYRRQYTVMGDAVNLAARLMSAAAPGQVLTTRRTADEAGSSCVTTDLKPIRVKGKSQPIDVCALEGKRTFASIAQVDAKTPLVGRDAEVAQLRAVADKAASGAGGSVLLVGEAGLGKSRLMVAFKEILDRADWQLVAGPCYAHTRSKPFAPWIGLLKGIFGVEHEDSVDEKVLKVWNAVAAADNRLVEYVSLLSPLLGLGLAHSEEVASLDDTLRRQRLFDLVEGVVQRTAASRPLALMVEDLHWSDRSSRELLMRVSRHANRVPLLLVCSTRPGGEDAVRLSADSMTRLELSELPREAALGILRSVLNRDAIAEHVLDTVFAKARGNPLFLEEMGRSLGREGVLERLESTSAGRVAEQMEALDVADRVQGLLMARIDALEEEVKNTLRVASVIGWTFDMRTLAGIVEKSTTRRSIEKHMNRLVEEAFIQRQASMGADAYHFRHALVQDVAYDSLPFARRRQLHARVGSRLETLFAATLDRHFEELAHHYWRSTDLDKARFYSLKAAVKARSVFAHDEAIAYLERVRKTVRSRTAEAACLRSGLVELEGDSYETAGHHDEAIRCYRDALARWRRVNPGNRESPSLLEDFAVEPDEVKESALCHKLAVAYERGHSHYGKALRWLEKALVELPPAHLLYRARLLATRAYVDVRFGHYVEAIASAREALRLAEQEDDTSQQATAINILGGAFRESGALREAVSCHVKAIQLFEDVGDIHGQAAAHGNLANCYEMRGELDLSLEHNEIALSLYERMGYSTGIQISRHNIGDVLVTLGRSQEALSHFTEVVREYEETGSGGAVAGLALVNLARAEQSFERWDRAQECVSRGIEILDAVGAEGLLFEAEYQLAELRLAQGMPSEARILATRALEGPRAEEQPVLAAKLLRVRGRAAAALGDVVTGEADLQTSVELADSIDAEHECGLSLLALAEFYARQVADDGLGHSDEVLARAMAIFERTGATGDLEEAHRLAQEVEERSRG